MIRPFQVTKGEITGVMMRGTGEASGARLSFSNLEKRTPAGRPLRTIRRIVDDTLARPDADFDALHTDFDRSSIAPERLIRANLLQMQMPFSIRSERQLPVLSDRR